MDVETATFVFAVLALCCLVAVGAVAVGAVVRALPGGGGRFAALRADLRRASLGLAWLIATVSTLGSLYLSEVARFFPCKLCLYPLALIRGIAALRRDRGVRAYVLPLAAIGAVIAAYHSWIQAFPPEGGSSFCTTDAPCTERYVWEFGFVSIPLMALSGFLFVITMMLLSRGDDATAPDLDTAEPGGVEVGDVEVTGREPVRSPA
jgi:disulfide bond formation protein DsbB